MKASQSMLSAPRRLCALLGVSLVLAVLASLPASARTWSIRADGLGDAPTIQAGIDSAAVGDTVLVGPGTYHEQIAFLGKDIVVEGEMGAENTVLDGSGLGLYGAFFTGGETRNAVLRGVTVKNSKIGIAVYESAPSILDNLVTENGGLGSAGGIYCTGNGHPGPWSPLIKGNIVTRNTAGTAPGIATTDKITAEIIDNYVAENRATTGDGGGIYVISLYDGTVIRGNRIENNFAGDHGGGIYVGGYFSPIAIEISDNLIWNNVANGRASTGESGGGMWLQRTNAWVHHNTIVQNTGNGPNDTYGGAITAQEPGSPLIERNIIALTVNGGGILCHSGITPVIRDNLGWQNQPVEGVGLCESWWQSDGNVIADPDFCGVAFGDFSVAANSPALTHPAGPLGAYPVAGCEPTAVEPVSWGGIKARFGAR